MQKYFLKELCLEIVGKCLMNCLHCSSSCNLNNHQYIPYINIKKILKDTKSLGTEIIELSGGEPLLHPDIINIIEEAKRDFEVRLYTSGYLGKAESLSQYCALFKKLDLDKIIFNLQGSVKTHDKITRTEGSFENVVNSIKIAKDYGLWTGVHFVPMKINYKELHFVAELCSNLRVDELAILRLVSQGRAQVNKYFLDLSLEEFNELLSYIVQLKKEYRTLLQLRTGCPMNFCSLIDKNMKPTFCKAGFATLLVKFDGTIVPCPAFKQAPDIALGDIHHTTLSQVWDNSIILNNLRNIDVRDIQGCNDCVDLSYCRGRCIAQRFYKYGNILQGPDPLCPHQTKRDDIKKKFLPVFA